MKSEMKTLFFKHKPPKEWSNPNYVLQVMLRKDGRTLDMRYKDTREFVYQSRQTRFYYFMQRVSVLLGNKKVGIHSLSWKHYLNPIYHIKQWWWLRKPIQIYGSDKVGVSEE